MRIAYVSADHGIPVFGSKGASIHVREMIGGFVAEGHEVHLFTSDAECREELPGARITPVGTPSVTAPTPPGVGADLLPRLQKEQKYIALGEAIEQEVAAVHEEHAFDFIYERYSLWSAAGVRLARRLQVPCAVEVNAPLLVEQKTYRKLVLEQEAAEIEREVFSSANCLLAVSREVADYCLASGGSEAQVLVNPNSVNTTLFHPSVPPVSLEGWAGAGPVIGFCGSLKPWHGVEQLLAAFRQVKLQRPDARLLIVGDGPRKDWIDGFVEGSGLGDSICLTGWREYTQLPSLLTHMDVAVAPYPEIEGFYFSPLKVFEYMAAGRTVVASNIGQIRELIRDAETGLLFSPGDVTHLAACLLRALDDADLRARLGASAHESMQQRSWGSSARRVCTLIRQRTGLQ